MNRYISIKSPADTDAFTEKTNALHDGYIIAAEYKNNGIKKSDDAYEFNFGSKRLIIRVLITSIRDAILEMVFDGISKWKITEANYAISEAVVGFDDEGFIVWADGPVDSDDIDENDSYVIAERMKWRFL